MYLFLYLNLKSCHVFKPEFHISNFDSSGPTVGERFKFLSPFGLKIQSSVDL